MPTFEKSTVPRTPRQARRSPLSARSRRRPLHALAQLEAESPVESLTIYRALAATHMAGAVLALLALPTAGKDIVDGMLEPLVAVTVGQLALFWWLLRRPRLLPRLLLRAPRSTWLVTVSLATLLLCCATSYAAYPLTLSGAAWLATAAAVGPPRGWPVLGVAVTAIALAFWTVAGTWDPATSGETAVVGAVQALLVFTNGAWMGAAGNRAAWRLRRWGLIVAREDGAIDRLQQDASRVKAAASALLARAAEHRAVEADGFEITLRQLRDDSQGIGDGRLPTMREVVEGVTDRLRVPFAVRVQGGDGLAAGPEAGAVVREALLRHLTNVVLHAPTARTVDIAIARVAADVQIRATDDGGGTPPQAADEGEGSAISRAAFSSVGGDVAYAAGPAGVALVMTVPEHAAEPEGGELGLAAGTRTFIDRALRNNRLVCWAAPVPALIWAFDAPLWLPALLLITGALVEWLIWRMGTSANPGDLPSLLAIGAASVALTAIFASAPMDSVVFPVGGATSFPIIELAWRGHWRLWALFETLRAVVVLPWVLDVGVEAIGSAFGFPIAVALIVIGGERLIRRAETLDERVGSAVARRRTALALARHASLRHDVVDQLLAQPTTVDLRAEIEALEAATRALEATRIELSRPADDVTDGIAAAIAPVPLEVEMRGRLDAGVPRFVPSALRLERTLATLEQGAELGADFVLATPPKWNGRRRVECVHATIERISPLELKVTLQATPVGVAEPLVRAIPG